MPQLAGLQVRYHVVQRCFLQITQRKGNFDIDGILGIANIGVRKFIVLHEDRGLSHGLHPVFLICHGNHNTAAACAD